MAYSIRFFISLSLVFFSLPAGAQFVTGTIAGATGGAGRGAIDGGEATYLNPAAVAHLQRYFFGSHYQSGNYGVDGDRSNYGILLADGTPDSIVPGAFSYTRKLIELSGLSITQQDIAVTLGNFPHRRIALGFTVHRLLSSQVGREDTQDNIHLGAIITPQPYLGLGFVVNDILNSSDTIPSYARTIRTYSMGGHIMMTEQFRLRLDLSQPEIQSGYEGRRTNVMAGLETYFRPEWAFRFGHQWQETKDQAHVTAGFGYLGPRLRFDYSFQKDTRSEIGARHLVDLWLPL